MSSTVSYENGAFDWSQTITFDFNEDYSAFTFVGTVVDPKPGECQGTMTGTGTRIGGVTSFKAYIPHITGGFSDWTDYLQADNHSSSSATFELTLFGSDGSIVYELPHTVAAYSRSEIDIKALRGAITAACGKITYTESLLNFRLTFKHDAGGLAEFRLTDDLGDSLGFYFTDLTPFVDWKGLALCNFSNSSATVTLQAIGNGAIIGTAQATIGANQKIVGIYQTWFSQAAFSDIESVRVTTTSDSLSGIAISGDMGNTQLLFTTGL